MAAACDGRLDIVRCLVENGADVNACNNSGNNSLMMACINRHMNVVKYLKDNQGKTSLQHASDGGRSEIIHELLSTTSGNLSKTVSPRQETLVYEAARDCSVVVLIDLLRRMSETDRKAALETKHKDGDQFTTPLIIAARSGNMLCVQELLKLSDIEERGTVRVGSQIIEGCTSLWTAAANGHLEVVKILLKENADVDGRNLSNSTPMMAAAYDGRLDIVRCLVENGGDVNARNNSKKTSLMMASFNGHMNVITYLIKRGANLDYQDKEGKTALQHAADRGYSEIEKELRFAVGNNSFKSDSFNLRKTLIYEAARDGNDVALKNLLRRMSDSDRKVALETKNKDGDQDTTPLIIAARNGNENAVRMLLKYGADIEARGTVKAGDQFKGGCGCCHRFEILRKAARRPSATRENDRGIEGCTPLCAAAAYAPNRARFPETLRYLVDYGADVNVCDNSLSTPLMFASYNGKMDVVSYLIYCGASVGLQNVNGDTALHEAIYGGHVEITKELLAHGESLQVGNDQCLTPLLLASRNCEIEMVECFIKRADCTRENKIEAVELLGSSISVNRYDEIEKAFYYMKLGMEERYQDPSLRPLLKEEAKPLEFYPSRKESQTLEELSEIEGRSSAIFLEGLIIGQRILGTSFLDRVPSYTFSIHSSKCYDAGEFDLSIRLRLQELETTLRNNSGLHQKDLIILVREISQMISKNTYLPNQSCIADAFNLTVRNCESLSETLQLNQVNSVGYKGSFPPEWLEIEPDTYSALYLLMIFAKLELLGKDENVFIGGLIQRYLRINPRTKNGNTLLHLTAWPETPMENVRDVCKHPCTETMRMVIDAGANVNDVNNKGETPLHLAATFKPSTDEEFQVLRDMLEMLLNKGACEYLLNNDGKTAMDMAETDEARRILENSMLQLKHLAARAVKQFGLPYLGIVPKTLEGFISMH